MRDIKFRAWDIEKKKMRHIITDLHWALHGLTGCKYILNEIDGGSLTNDADCVGGKDRFILMQYTGLKDKKGVEIYDEDILHLVFEDLELRGVVQQTKSGEWELYKDEGNHVGVHHNIDRIEIIGNIHQA